MKNAMTELKQGKTFAAVVLRLIKHGQSLKTEHLKLSHNNKKE
jgi:hypothetical protein